MECWETSARVLWFYASTHHLPSRPPGPTAEASDSRSERSQFESAGGHFGKTVHVPARELASGVWVEPKAVLPSTPPSSVVQSTWPITRGSHVRLMGRGQTEQRVR